MDVGSVGEMKKKSIKGNTVKRFVLEKGTGVKKYTRAQKLRTYECIRRSKRRKGRETAVK